MFSAIFQLLALSSSYAFPVYVPIMPAEQLEKTVLLSSFLSVTNLGDLLCLWKCSLLPLPSNVWKCAVEKRKPKCGWETGGFSVFGGWVKVEELFSDRNSFTTENILNQKRMFLEEYDKRSQR